MSEQAEAAIDIADLYADYVKLLMLPLFIRVRPVVQAGLVDLLEDLALMTGLDMEQIQNHGEALAELLSGGTRRR